MISTRSVPLIALTRLWKGWSWLNDTIYLLQKKESDSLAVDLDSVNLLELYNIVIYIIVYTVKTQNKKVSCITALLFLMGNLTIDKVI